MARRAQQDMNTLTLNQAFRFVVIAMMLAQINQFCSKLGLNSGHEVTEADMREGGHVGLANSNSFTGSILTDKYFFGFWHGYLANFYERGFSSLSDADVMKRNIELSKHSSLIDTNDAYQLATNWLAKSGVDVRGMETKYALNIIQWRYYPNGQLGPEPKRKEIVLPVYQLEWKGSLSRGTRKLPDVTVVKVVVSGINKGMLEYHVYDDSLILTPKMQIVQCEKLLAIQDEELRGYDSLQRSNLVVRFGLLGAPAQSSASESNSVLPGVGESGNTAKHH